MKTLLAFLAALDLALFCCNQARANMPPPSLDMGNESMSEREVLRVYSKEPGFNDLELHRVPFGQARQLCVFFAELHGTSFSSLPTYGCSVGNIVVYSYDTPALARSQNRDYSPRMANHVLRHEFAHALFGWPASHPNDCETICEEEGR